MALYQDDVPFEHAGLKFVARFYVDDDSGPPWEQNDCHGAVTDWVRRGKLPGELVLHKDKGFVRYYDYAGAMRIAKRDGWDAEPYKTGTKGERAHRAVMRDFEYLRSWCNDDWWYIGIDVTLATDDGDFDESCEYEHALWGIESNSTDHHTEEMHELAHDIIAERVKDHQAAA